MEKRQPAALGGGIRALATPSVAVPTPRLVPGFRFHPTDEELVVYYLRRKVCRKPFRSEAIAEVDIYKFEPWELQVFSAMNTRDQEWYFFTGFEKKFGSGSRLNRSTGKGYWKATGKDRIVRHNSKIVGMKKTLVYYAGRAHDWRRRNWVMHEYRLVEEELEKAGVEQKDSFMLCRISMKNELGPPGSDVYGSFNEEDWENDAELSPGLLNFSLSVEPKENNAPNVDALDSSSLEKPLPPGYLKFITDLEEEREELKIAVMKSETRISSLKAKNEQLAEEIRRLSRSIVLKD